MNKESLPLEQLQPIDTAAVKQAITRQELSSLQPVETDIINEQVSRQQAGIDSLQVIDRETINQALNEHAGRVALRGVAETGDTQVDSTDSIDRAA